MDECTMLCVICYEYAIHDRIIIILLRLLIMKYVIRDEALWKEQLPVPYSEKQQWHT